MTSEKIIEFAAKYGLTLVGDPHAPFFNANKIGDILGIRKMRNTLSCMPDNEKATIGTQSNGGLQLTLHINIQGLKRILAHSRKLSAKAMAADLGMDVFNTQYDCTEAVTIRFIMSAFAGETMTQQYAVGSYRVDLYLNEHNIVVECDERGHNGHNALSDAQRQEVITATLHCQFVRYRPDGDDMAVVNAINQVFRIIMSQRQVGQCESRQRV